MRDDRKENREKLEAGEIDVASASPILRFLDNFWYYHKWKVIIIAFFALVLIVAIVQIAGKEDNDASVIVAVPQTLYAEEMQALQSDLLAVMPSDRSGDGKKTLLLSAYPIYSEDEMIAANEEETDDDGRFIKQVEGSYNTQKMEEYTDYLLTGECSVLIVSEYLYSNLLAQGRVRPLTELFGDDLPEGARADGCGVDLAKTTLYEYSNGLGNLPQNTVVCLLRPYVYGASSDAEKYAFYEEYFKAIVAFGN
jgi:hypothetical protein